MSLEHTRERGLEPGELAFAGAAPGIPLVIERAPEGPSLADALGGARETVRARLKQHGAILFRGFGVGGADEFERALAALGLSASADYPFGVSPRPAVTRRVFKSTEYANFMVIPPHTEMAYLRYRPYWIAFFCELPPQRFGETPLYDMALAFESLPAALRDRLRRTEMRYVRHIRHKKALVTFERTIGETFGTVDRGQIAETCRQLDIGATWLGDDFLRAETVLPAVIAHPETGRSCLNAQFVNADSLIAAIARVRERYPPMKRQLINAYIRHQFRKPTVHYRSMPVDGPDFTPAELAAIDAAIQGASTAFVWRRGDVLLIDNVRAAHGRLNVSGPRRILTALGDMYDAKALPRSAAA